MCPSDLPDIYTQARGHGCTYRQITNAHDTTDMYVHTLQANSLQVINRHFNTKQTTELFMQIYLWNLIVEQQNLLLWLCLLTWTGKSWKNSI